VLKEDPVYNLDHVVSLQIQFPEGTKYSYVVVLRNKLPSAIGCLCNSATYLKKMRSSKLNADNT
jgi:hypothetical protein